MLPVQLPLKFVAVVVCAAFETPVCVADARGDVTARTKMNAERVRDIRRIRASRVPLQPPQKCADFGLLQRPGLAAAFGIETAPSVQNVCERESSAGLLLRSNAVCAASRVPRVEQIVRDDFMSLGIPVAVSRNEPSSNDLVGFVAIDELREEVDEPCFVLLSPLAPVSDLPRVEIAIVNLQRPWMHG